MRDDTSDRQTILIVEPDDAIRDELATAANRYNVITVHQVATGIRAAQRHHPSVVLLSLDTLDAPGLTEIVAFRSLYPDASIIATTGNINLIRGAISTGADDCVLVPISADELSQRIEVAMARGVRAYSRFYVVYDAMKDTLREKREHDSTVLVQAAPIG